MELDESSAASTELTRNRLAGGLEPAAVADLVLDGVARDRLWIHTAPDVSELVLRARTDGLLAGIRGTAG